MKALFFTRMTLFPPLDKRNTRDKVKVLCISSERYIGELGVRCLSTLNRGQDSRQQPHEEEDLCHTTPPYPYLSLHPPSPYRIDLYRRVKSISTGQGANLYGSIRCTSTGSLSDQYWYI